MLKNAWYTCVACAMLWFGSVLFFIRLLILDVFVNLICSGHCSSVIGNCTHDIHLVCSWEIYLIQVGLYFPNWMAYMIHVQGLECMKVCSERVWQTWRLHLSWMQLKAQHFERSILLQKQNMQLLLPGEATDSLTIGTPKCSLQINLLTEIAYISRSISAKKISDRVEFCCHS